MRRVCGRIRVVLVGLVAVAVLVSGAPAVAAGEGSAGAAGAGVPWSWWPEAPPGGWYDLGVFATPSRSLGEWINRVRTVVGAPTVPVDSRTWAADDPDRHGVAYDGDRYWYMDIDIALSRMAPDAAGAPTPVGAEALDGPGVSDAVGFSRLFWAAEMMLALTSPQVTAITVGYWTSTERVDDFGDPYWVRYEFWVLRLRLDPSLPPTPAGLRSWPPDRWGPQMPDVPSWLDYRLPTRLRRLEVQAVWHDQAIDNHLRYPQVFDPLTLPRVAVIDPALDGMTPAGEPATARVRYSDGTTGTVEARWFLPSEWTTQPRTRTYDDPYTHVGTPEEKGLTSAPFNPVAVRGSSFMDGETLRRRREYGAPVLAIPAVIIYPDRQLTTDLNLRTQSPNPGGWVTATWVDRSGRSFQHRWPVLDIHGLPRHLGPRVVFDDQPDRDQISVRLPDITPWWSTQGVSGDWVVRWRTWTGNPRFDWDGTVRAAGWAGGTEVFLPRTDSRGRRLILEVYVEPPLPAGVDRDGWRDPTGAWYLVRRPHPASQSLGPYGYALVSRRAASVVFDLDGLRDPRTTSIDGYTLGRLPGDEGYLDRPDVVDIAVGPTGLPAPVGTGSSWGLYLLFADGRLTTYRTRPDGSPEPMGDASGRLQPGERAAAVAWRPSGDGYWVFTDRGRVFAFGAARHHGDMSGRPLVGPVIDAVPTPSGNGYWMVASDGGIFAFGDARFYGSMGGRRLNAPVVGMVPDPDGVGYWLFASDGGVFAFKADFRGSMGGRRLNAPVTGGTAYGKGYALVGADGGVFVFSDLPFRGSLGDRPLPPDNQAVAIAAWQLPRVADDVHWSPDPPQATTLWGSTWNRFLGPLS